MKIFGNTDGQMRVIESIMASFIIVFAITFVNLFAVTPPSPMYETSELEKVGYNVLHDLDEQRLLAHFVCNSTPEWENLTAALMICIPPDVYFNLTVYYLNGTAVDTGNVSISYGDPEVFTTSSAVSSVLYLVPGYQENYNPRILILKLVRG